MELGMIYCVGRNYAAHAKELGNNIPLAPIIFFKPPASAVDSDKIITIPPFSKNVQFEVELAFRVDVNLNISEICVANDLTARDKQKEAQEAKAPWSLGKGFKESCGFGNWVKLSDDFENEFGRDFKNLELRLTHNGKLSQNGLIKDMIFSVSEILAYLKDHFPLRPKDIVLTGTPEGVGTVFPGDEIHLELIHSVSKTVISTGSWKFQS